MQLIEAAGYVSLMVQRTEPSVRYVAVDGPVSRIEAGTDEQLVEVTKRYLSPEAVDAISSSRAANWASRWRCSWSRATGCRPTSGPGEAAASRRRRLLVQGLAYRAVTSRRLTFSD